MGILATMASAQQPPMIGRLAFVLDILQKGLLSVLKSQGKQNARRVTDLSEIGSLLDIIAINVQLILKLESFCTHAVHAITTSALTALERQSMRKKTAWQSETAVRQQTCGR